MISKGHWKFASFTEWKFSTWTTYLCYRELYFINFVTQRNMITITFCVDLCLITLVTLNRTSRSCGTAWQYVDSTMWEITGIIYRYIKIVYQSSDMVPLGETSKTEVDVPSRSYSRCVTIKIPPCSKAVAANTGLNFAGLLSAVGLGEYQISRVDKSWCHLIKSQ